MIDMDMEHLNTASVLLAAPCIFVLVHFCVYAISSLDTDTDRQTTGRTYVAHVIAANIAMCDGYVSCTFDIENRLK